MASLAPDPAQGERAMVMGVVNVTPDSFSDGGRYMDPTTAVAHGMALVDEGADVVDVGGESSRPGAEPVPEAEELRRVIPVIEALAPRARVSVDTVKPGVAEAAVAAGATLLNDISGTLGAVAGKLGVGWVSMHMQGSPRTMQADPHYEDVVAEVHAWVLSRARDAAQAGVEEIWVDPGIGFGKTKAHNLALLGAVKTLVAMARREGFGVLVGTSRKRFLSDYGTPGEGSGPLPVDERLAGSVATAVWAMEAGAGMIRAHDVRATVDAAKLVGRVSLAARPRRGRVTV